MRGYLFASVLFLVRVCACASEPVLEVPFEFLHNQIVMTATINGVGPCNVILDTGTHASSIDAGLAAALKLPLSTTRLPGVGAGTGKVFGRLGAVEELNIGGLPVRNLPVVSLDLSKVSRQLGRPLHAVLGFSFLNGRIVQIDYFRRRVRFPAERPLSPELPGRLAFKMQFRDGSILPVLEDCFVEGTRLALTLDTGSSLGLILFPQAVRHLGVEDRAREGLPLQAVGYLGAARLRKGWIRSLALRTVDLGAVEVAYVEKGYGDHEDLARRGGNLGNAILQDFVLTLDYRNRVVVLEQVEQ